MAESGTRQPKAGDEIFRSGPDDLLVEDDGLHSASVGTAGSMRGNYPGGSPITSLQGAYWR
jgi:hypothetical protein